MRVPTILLTFLLLLTACAAPANPIAGSQDTGALEPQKVIVDGTFETSLLVTVWKGLPEGNVLFPIDPATGSALPGYKPISLGQTASHAFSSDRRTLAVVSFPDQNTYNGSLVLVDLTTWRSAPMESGWLSHMANPGTD